MSESWLLLAAIVVFQYILAMYLHIKYGEKLGPSITTAMWIPIIGPIALVMTIVLIIMFVTPFLLPLVIANGMVWVLRKISNKDINYL